MNIECVGAGPAGLFFSILHKRADPGAAITVSERSRKTAPRGFGIVVPEKTVHDIAAADPETGRRLADLWVDLHDIVVDCDGTARFSRGHRFRAIARESLLGALADRCAELGVDVVYDRTIESISELPPADLVVVANGGSSAFRDAIPRLAPRVQRGSNWYMWFGSSKPFDAFTFCFLSTPQGVWRIHAYPYADRASTIIVECTDATFRGAKLALQNEREATSFCEDLLHDALQGHALRSGGWAWQQFHTVRSQRWHDANVVLLGDAAHTAHFSIGSGTTLALESAIALSNACRGGGDISSVLRSFEAGRRENVKRTQEAGDMSRRWFESTERYMKQRPDQFALNLLTRTRTAAFDDLERKDPALVARVMGELDPRNGRAGERGVGRPSMTPTQLGGLTIPSRIVGRISADTAQDVGLGVHARAGLVMIDDGFGDRIELSEFWTSICEPIEPVRGVRVDPRMYSERTERGNYGFARRVGSFLSTERRVIELDWAWCAADKDDEEGRGDEICRSVRRLRSDYQWSWPILVALSVPVGGRQARRFLRIMRWLSDSGCDGIVLRWPATRRGSHIHADTVDFSERVRLTVGMPTIVECLGDLPTPRIDALIAAGSLDFCVASASSVKSAAA